MNDLPYEAWLNENQRAAFSTEEIDRDAAARAIARLYHLHKLTVPPFHFTASPYWDAVKGERHGNEVVMTFASTFSPSHALLNAGSLRIEPLSARQSITLAIEVARQIRRYGISWQTSFYGSLDLLTLGHDVFSQRHSLSMRDDYWQIIYEIGKTAFWFMPLRDVCYVSDRPSEINYDSEGHLHSRVSAALRFRDGKAIYALQGFAVRCEVIEEPESLTLRDVMGIENVETRRVTLEHLGAEWLGRFDKDFADCGSDRYGTLLRYDANGQLPIMLVRVTNSTPEADGSFKQYYLRVPPNMRSAHEAVAWTFNMKTADYNPIQET